MVGNKSMWESSDTSESRCGAFLDLYDVECGNSCPNTCDDVREFNVHIIVCGNFLVHMIVCGIS